MISDFAIIGAVTLVIAVICFCVWAVFEIIKHAPTVTITGENLFIISEIVVMCLFNGIVAISQKSNVDVGKFTIVIATGSQGLALWLPYYMYCVSSSVGTEWGLTPWPSIFPVLIIFEILNILTIPFVIAYARCKE